MATRGETVDVRREIEELVAFDGRVAGSDAERRAALHLRGRLEALGREATVEPTSVLPGWAAAHALHALVAVVGSVLAVDRPVLGTAVVALAVLSALGDLTGLFHLGRRLTGRRASQNVTSREDGGKPGRLVLVAHYDAARTGALFGRRTSERRAALARLLRRPLGTLGPYVWALVVVLACSALRIPGLEALALTIVQFLATVVLIVAVPLFGDVALSRPVPGANDNASGVATVLRLAERHGGALEHFDLWVVLTGAGESVMAGMREWLRAHRGELERASTVVLCVDTVGAGLPRYATREGIVLASRYHPALLALCDELAEDHGARRHASREVSDAHMARVRGLPALRVSCLNALGYAPHRHLPSDTPERVEDSALERALAFCSDLVELIDERIGPDLASETGADDGALAEDDER